MAFSSIRQKTKFTGFTRSSDKDQILAAMETAYNGSTTARAMFDNWINLGNTIDIRFEPNYAGARTNQGIVLIDPLYVVQLSYIDDKGTAVPYTLITALTHEFGHALSGKSDPNVGLVVCQA